MRTAEASTAPPALLRLTGLPTAGAPSEAPAGIAAPTLAGQSAAAAAATLRRMGLTVRQRTAPSEMVPPGRVIATAPAAGEILFKGATVTLIVAAPVKVPVPAVTGLGVDEAAGALRRLGLHWRRQTRQSAAIAPGRVIATAPAVGQSIPKGGAVTLFVAVAPAPVHAAPADRAPYPAGNQFGQPYPSYRPPPVAAPPPAYSTPAPAYAAPAQTPLSGDALIGHLYDNAHAGN
jgi:hypothetical protein